MLDFSVHYIFWWEKGAKYIITILIKKLRRDVASRAGS